MMDWVPISINGQDFEFRVIGFRHLDTQEHAFGVEWKRKPFRPQDLTDKEKGGLIPFQSEEEAVNAAREFLENQAGGF